MLSILLISEVFIAGILSCLLDNLIPGDWHALYSAPYLLLVRPVLRKSRLCYHWYIDLHVQ